MSAAPGEPVPPAQSQLRQLSVLIAANFVDMIGFAIVLPLLPFYALHLDATPFQIGLIIAAFSAAQLLSAPLWGRVSDRYGRRPALLIGLLASAVAYVVFGLADSIWLLFASRLIQGAGGGTTGVAQAYVADTIKPRDRARALGWLSAATSAGVMLGPVIGSFAARFGQEAPGFAAAGLCVLNAAFAWRWLPESRKPGSGGSVRKPAWHAVWGVIRHPAEQVSRLILIYAVGMLAFSLLSAVLALYLDAEFAVDERSIGWYYTYIGALSLVMRSLLLGPIVDRIGETRAMRLGTIVMVAGLALYPVPGSIWMLALVMPLVPVGTALLFPSTTALMSRQADRDELGTVMGAAQTFGGIARVAAPLLGTMAFEFHHDLPFLVAGTIVAFVGVLAFRITPFRSADTPTPGTPTA
jgi:multidrug resistance protein